MKSYRKKKRRKQEKTYKESNPLPLILPYRQWSWRWRERHPGRRNRGWPRRTPPPSSPSLGSLATSWRHRRRDYSKWLLYYSISMSRPHIHTHQWLQWRQGCLISMSRLIYTHTRLQWRQGWLMWLLYDCISLSRPLYKHIRLYTTSVMGVTGVRECLISLLYDCISMPATYICTHTRVLILPKANSSPH